MNADRSATASDGREQSLPPYRTIVVGTDGSATAQEAVRHAIAMARAHGAALHLVSAASGKKPGQLVREARSAPRDITHSINAYEDVEEMLQQIADRVRPHKVAVTCHAAINQRPADAILKVARQCKADLIVVGNRGMTGLGRALGSVPNTISHSASCNVAIIRTT